MNEERKKRIQAGYHLFQKFLETKGFTRDRYRFFTLKNKKTGTKDTFCVIKNGANGELYYTVSRQNKKDPFYGSFGEKMALSRIWEHVKTSNFDRVYNVTFDRDEYSLGVIILSDLQKAKESVLRENDKYER